MDDDLGAAPPPVIRSEDAELYIEDTDVGWAEMRVVVGQHDSGFYGFSLVWDPLEDVRKFEQDLASVGAGRMVLRGEPGAVEVIAAPAEPDGWVRLSLWLIDYRNACTLDFEAFCPASSLVASMRTNIGFIARDYERRRSKVTTLRNLGQKLGDWLAKRRSRSR